MVSFIIPFNVHTIHLFRDVCAELLFREVVVIIYVSCLWCASSLELYGFDDLP